MERQSASGLPQSPVRTSEELATVVTTGGSSSTLSFVSIEQTKVRRAGYTVSFVTMTLNKMTHARAPLLVSYQCSRRKLRTSSTFSFVTMALKKVTHAGSTVSSV